jgi:hypothetical protein
MYQLGYGQNIAFGYERTPVVNGLFRTKFQEGKTTYSRVHMLMPHGQHSIKNPDPTAQSERIYLPCARRVAVVQEVIQDQQALRAVIGDGVCPICLRANPRNDQVWNSQVHMATYHCLLASRAATDYAGQQLEGVMDLEIWSFRPESKNANRMLELNMAIGQNEPLTVCLEITCSSTRYQNIAIKTSPQQYAMTPELEAKLREHVAKGSLEAFCEPPTAEAAEQAFLSLMHTGQANLAELGGAAAVAQAGMPPGMVPGPAAPPAALQPVAPGTIAPTIPMGPPVTTPPPAAPPAAAPTIPMGPPVMTPPPAAPPAAAPPTTAPTIPMGPPAAPPPAAPPPAAAPPATAPAQAAGGLMGQIPVTPTADSEGVPESEVEKLLREQKILPSS